MENITSNEDFNKHEYKPIKNIQRLDKDNSTISTFEVNNLNWQGKKENEIIVDKNLNVSVFDVAAYILQKLGELTTMKLHKLLYYCQAWSLVWDEKPLFNEEIEAWANGPVIRDLYAYHKGFYSISSISIGNPDCLDLNQKETVNSVLEFYGTKSAQWLIELTHLEEPWTKARQGLAPLERGSSIISNASMAEYYSSL